MKTGAMLVAVLAAAVFAGEAQAAIRIMTGTVQDINVNENKASLQLKNEQGQPEQVALKWKDDLRDLQLLESAKVGSQLTVEANDWLGEWQVTRVIPGQPNAGQAGAS